MSDETVMPEKLDLRSHDIVADKMAELLRLFPEVRTEGDKIDFDRLKRVLGETVDPGKERYGLNWPGKAECFKAIQTPSMGTLLPCPDESVDFDTSENLIIEGDNLEVLKLLQKAYLGKVRIIYIDPPYNTGNDFVYPDNYTESLQTYLQYTGQVDSEGKKFNTNLETDGRFHSKWLNMMYPRLYLARNLLREDGVIMISIDDSEQDSLKKICNEIFGEENFVAQLVWEKGRKNDAKLVSTGHEYVLLFARNRAHLNEQGEIWREGKPGAAEVQTEYLKLREALGSNEAVQAGLRSYFSSLSAAHPAKKLSRYNNVDDAGVWRDDNISWPGGGGPTYDVIHPSTGRPCVVPEGGWRYSTLGKMQEMIAAGRVVFRATDAEPPIRKTYLVRGESAANDDDVEDEIGVQVAGSYFYRSGLQASRAIADLFGERVFNNPKDHEVLMRWFRYVGSRSKDDLVLDFFAGSGSTGQAVLELNRLDGGHRRFILVQLPEPTDHPSYPTISSITRARVRKVIEKMHQDASGELPLSPPETEDLGFRAFSLNDSNLVPWNPAAKDGGALSEQIGLHINHIRQSRGELEILCEVLLKSGYPPTVRIEKVELSKHKVYSVSGDALIVCLEKNLSLDLIRAIAERSPSQVVVLDSGFAGNDQLKANAAQIFRSKDIVFRTV